MSTDDKIRKLEAENKALKDILESAPFYVFVKTECKKNFYYSYVNRRGGKLYGMDVGDIVGNEDVDSIPDKSDAAAYRKADLSVFDNDEEIWVWSEKYSRHGRQDIALSTAKAPLKDEQGRVYGVVAFAKNLEDMLGSEHIQNIASLCGQFGHSIRNKIGGLSANIRAVVDENGEDAEVFSRIEKTLNALSALSDRAIVASGYGDRWKPVPVDLTKVVTSAVQSSEDPRVNLRIETNRSTVQGSELHLTEVLLELVENALRNLTCDSNSVDRVRVTLKPNEDDEDWIKVFVSDRGAGFNSEDFQNALRIGNSKRASLGLGLPFVLQVVSLHNGRFTLEQKPEHGFKTTLCIELRRGNDE